MTAEATYLEDDDNDWRLLRVYVYYRLVLAFLLVGLFALRPSEPLLGAQNPKLYLIVSVTYLVICSVSLVMTGKLRTEPRFQGFLLTLLDVFAVTMIMHTNGGPSIPLSMLFLVIVAAGNILLTGKQGPLIAAVATVAVLYQQFYSILSDDATLNLQTLAQSSLLGLSFFAVALFSQLVSHRFRQMETLARLRSQEIANLQHLNEQIIERMLTGILVVNDYRRLILINHASRQLLGVENVFTGINLREISPQLDEALLTWENEALVRPLIFKNQPGYPELSASFMSLGHGGGFTLIFIENTAQMTQKAQQLKLASLGRLTASIAHEIRNPLGAISHAAQLLAESPAIEGPDRRLLTIVQQHCVRVNGIIESVLQLSRRERSLPELFRVEEWLDVFLEDMQHIHPEIEIHKACKPAMEVRFDPQQLYQVLSNLVANAIHHGQLNHQNAIRVVCDDDPISHLPYLEIRDQGRGVPPDQVKHLFEPFYTTGRNGTGLGLYISRELCEANQAHLDYIPQDSGACFRITFSHPNRLI